MSNKLLSPEAVELAYKRIRPFINETPLLKSTHLNEWLGHDIIFKVEGFQKIGAFKIRGALNTLLTLKEQEKLPQEVVTFSSGNHAQAVALACSLFKIKSTIFMTKHASKIKKQATEGYGANVILTENRPDAESRTCEMQKRGAYFIHPFDNDMVIEGQGTSCYEALKKGVKPDAIFATCGGGGLLSGTYLAKELLSKESLIFAGEPANADDALRSYNSGKIFAYKDSPQTIADGAMSLCVSERTFSYLKKIDGFYSVTEEEIIYWTQWLMHLLKTTIEPTSAVAMGAAFKWLKAQKNKQKILIILSGGNISPDTYKKVWQNDFLDQLPKI
ncbi:serine/threonine dehydratase [Rickettsiales bacterium]|nr:serine/threonine dehydratase [Rickettsiales bacterium]